MDNRQIKKRQNEAKMEKFQLVTGYQFSPSDQELLRYLERKTKGREFEPWKNAVLELDLYSVNSDVPWILFTDDDPWQITQKIDVENIRVEKVIYVVTKLKKIGASNSVRTVGSFTWEVSGKKDIWNDRGKIVGFKRSLSLKVKNGIEKHGKWTMNEYHLPGVQLQEPDENETVICRIKWQNSKTITAATTSKVEESDGLGELVVRSDQYLPVKKRAILRINSNVVISEPEVQEGEANRENTDQCESSSKGETGSDQERARKKGVSCTAIVVYQENLVAKRSRFSETEIQDKEANCANSSDLENLIKEKPRCDQEKPIRRESCSCSSFNSNVQNVIDLERSPGRNENPGGESNTTKQVKD